MRCCEILYIACPYYCHFGKIYFVNRQFSKNFIQYQGFTKKICVCIYLFKYIGFFSMSSKSFIIRIIKLVGCSCFNTQLPNYFENFNYTCSKKRKKKRKEERKKRRKRKGGKEKEEGKEFKT